jgi:DNA-nicking Smr family endonuclease
MSRRAIDPEEGALWREAMRDVAPARRGKAKPVPEPEAILSGEAKRATPAKAGARGDAVPAATTDAGLRRPNEIPKSLHDSVPGLDRRTALRLRRGQLPVEARLDLHGMTQEEAHRALAGFVAQSHAAGRRVLLVVTGKGSRAGTGILRAAVPRWLGDPALRARVLATAPAVPRDGGDGALYLLLRRAR